MALPPRGKGRPVGRGHQAPRLMGRFHQAVIAVGELAFVDNEAGVELAGNDRGG